MSARPLSEHVLPEVRVEVLPSSGDLPEALRDAVDLAIAERYDFGDCLTRRRNRMHEPDLAAAVVCARGVLAHAARLLGVTRNRVAVYVHEHPHFRPIVLGSAGGVAGRVGGGVLRGGDGGGGSWRGRGAR